jgi:hypothetical protein
VAARSERVVRTYVVLEHEVEFRASKTRAFWIVLACLGLTAVGIAVGLSGEWVGWGATAFFGLGLAIGIVQVILASRTVLKLDPRGFAMIQWGGKHHRDSWGDVESFRVTNFVWNKVIAITYSPSYQKARKTRQIVHRLTGFEGTIPNQYTEPIETVCAALNEWKRRYG